MTTRQGKLKWVEKPVILVDLDDTLTWFVPAWLKWLNHEYGYNVKHKDVTAWDFRFLYPTLSSKQLHEPLGKPEFWKSVEIREDAKDYLKRLYELGFDIYLCTATYYKDIEMKYNIIIKEHFPYIDWNHVIVAHNKQMIRGDYLIDDHIDNLVGGEYTKILLTTPRSKDFDGEPYHIYKCDNWQQITDFIITNEIIKNDDALPF